MRLAIDQADREGRDPIDDSLLDGVESPGADTMSDDGTIDGNEHMADIGLPPRHISPFVLNPRVRPRPRSLHELPSYHVEMPLFGHDQIQRFGAWTPNDATLAGPASQPLLGTQMDMPAFGYSYRSRSPAMPGPSDSAAMQEFDLPSPARTPSRRHTLIESTNGYFGQQPPPPPPAIFPTQSHAAFERFADAARSQRRPQPQFVPTVPPPPPPHHGTHLYDLGMRSAQDIRQTYLRPDHEFSAFDANHEAIMSTIPGSQSASRHPSRSNSPHPSRVSSRSRLSNIMSSLRTNPFSSADGRGPFSSRSLSRSRREEEEHRQRMLHALAEADAAQQLRPEPRRGESSRTIELPLLAPDQVERVVPSMATRGESSRSGSNSRQSPMPSEPEDVTMTQ